MTAAEQATTEAELAQLATKEAARRKALREREEEREAAMTAYRRQEALQLVQVAIDGARNAVALTAAFAYAGPWAPVIATSIAGVQAGTPPRSSVQPPPQFHFGTTAAFGSQPGAVGIPGAERPAVLEQGERHQPARHGDAWHGRARRGGQRGSHPVAAYDGHRHRGRPARTALGRPTHLR